MKVVYDRETDSLVITLREAPIRESDEVRPAVIADFGEDGAWSASRSCAPRASSRTPSGCSSRRPADGDDGGGEPRHRVSLRHDIALSAHITRRGSSSSKR
jgi:hypothetical protein